MSDNRVYSYSAVLMGSPILLKLCSHDEAMASRVFQLIKRYEDLLTVNRAESQVMDINHAAGRHPVTVSRPVFQLIQCAKAASMVRDSAFNLAIGPLVKLWRIGFHGHSVPDAADIRARLALTRPQEVILDEATCSVFLQQPGMELDLGAIAKGYIADRVRDFLRQQQVEKALINLGGNVHTLGEWAIGLKKTICRRAGADRFPDGQRAIGSHLRDLRALFRTGWQTLAPYSRPAQRLSAGQRTRQRDGHFRGFFRRRHLDHAAVRPRRGEGLRSAASAAGYRRDFRYQKSRHYSLIAAAAAFCVAGQRLSGY